MSYFSFFILTLVLGLITLALFLNNGRKVSNLAQMIYFFAMSIYCMLMAVKG